MENLQIVTNQAWLKNDSPMFTVITPVYNRKELVQRTLESVREQTYRDFEYIVVDDGSTQEQSIDEIMKCFMHESDIPIMFIKKTNGGVHTARNIATKNGRGTLWVPIDSDDLLMPDALEKFYDVWCQIPEKDRWSYYGIGSFCALPNGSVYGIPWPDNINRMDKPGKKILKEHKKYESHGACCMDIMKKNLWPEPEKVTFVPEGIVWERLEKIYRVYYSNCVTRIYDMNEDRSHLSGIHKKNIQLCRNACWESKYELSNRRIYCGNPIQYGKTIFRYCVMKRILRDANDLEFIMENELEGIVSRLIEKVISPIVRVYAIAYKKQRM